MTPLQDRLPFAPWTDPAAWRLPGVRPVGAEEWLIRDEAFAGQMALRDRLIATRAADVLDFLPGSEVAAAECLDLALASLGRDPGYRVGTTEVLRPDGATVPLDRAAPFATLGRLVQADICLMEGGPAGHVLTGAVLCFPAGWTLAEKLGRPLAPIHAPVARYDGEVERRVQRLFDAIRPGQVLARANAHLHAEPDLFTPAPESAPKRRARPAEARYVRSERQTLRRLPASGAVVFAIHTLMVPIDRLNEIQLAGLNALA